MISFLVVEILFIQSTQHHSMIDGKYFSSSFSDPFFSSFKVQQIPVKVCCFGFAFIVSRSSLFPAINFKVLRIMMKKIQLHFLLLSISLSFSTGSLSFSWHLIISTSVRFKAKYIFSRQVYINMYRFFSLVFFNVRFRYAPHMIPFMEDRSGKRDHMKLYFRDQMREIIYIF